MGVSFITFCVKCFSSKPKKLHLNQQEASLSLPACTDWSLSTRRSQTGRSSKGLGRARWVEGQHRESCIKSHLHFAQITRKALGQLFPSSAALIASRGARLTYVTQKSWQKDYWQFCKAIWTWSALHRCQVKSEFSRDTERLFKRSKE